MSEREKLRQREREQERDRDGDRHKTGNRKQTQESDSVVLSHHVSTALHTQQPNKIPHGHPIRSLTFVREHFSDRLLCFSSTLPRSAVTGSHVG